jgi:Zn-dependent peptidase ImmA (M78 family)
MTSSCTEYAENEVKISPKLQSYFDTFAKEAAERGIEVDFAKNGIFGDLDIITSSTGAVGQCFHNKNSPNRVLIDVRYWNKIDSNSKEFLIFHELGHCILFREHLDSKKSNGHCISIMHSSEDVCKFEYDKNSRKEYIDELFKQ